MPLGNKSLRIAAANDDRSWQWQGQPVDLVEAVPPFVLEPEPTVIEDDRKGWFAVALSWTISNIMEGLTLYAAGMHPEIHHASAGVGDVLGNDNGWLHPRQLAGLESSMFPEAGASERTGDLDGYAPTKPVGRASAGWIVSILSIFAMPWRRCARTVEMHRMRMALQALDDRTLRDIGLSRHDIDAVVRYGRRPY
jgi:uncharacterized protein YjiS (DUF1127 family)